MKKTRRRPLRQKRASGPVSARGYETFRRPDRTAPRLRDFAPSGAAGGPRVQDFWPSGAADVALDHAKYMKHIGYETVGSLGGLGRWGI